MRRKDREITGKEQLEVLLKGTMVCRIALNTGEAPYIVPLNFGYLWEDRLSLYFHSASVGRKLDLIAADPRAGFEVDLNQELVRGENPCDWTMRYGSLIGTGRISLVEDPAEKKAALDRIMIQCGHKGPLAYPEVMMKRIGILCLDVEEISGKVHK